MMIKNTIFWLLFFSVFAMQAQSKRVQLDWDADKQTQPATKQQQSAKKQTSGSNSFIIRYNKEENTYSEQWRASAYVAPNSVQLSNIVFENISQNQLDGVPKERIPKEITYSVRTGRGRNQLYTVFEVTPIIRENGQFKRVVSFTVNYSEGQNPVSGKSMPLTNSVLASGEWFRFKIDKKGVYRIDRSFLQNLGMDVEDIDPRTLKIYGNGARMLPLQNSLNEDFDPVENAIQVVGEEDGSFDAGDYILFYADAESFSEENTTHLNIYDENAYYYVTAGGENGKRMSPLNEPSGNATTTIDRFNNYQYHEVDEASPGLVGRRWFGERFDVQNEQSFTFQFPNIIQGEPMDVTIEATAASEAPTSMTSSVNGEELPLMSFSAISSASSTLAYIRNTTDMVNATSEEVEVALTYNNGGNPSSVAHLDYITIDALCSLRGTGNQLHFQYNEAALLSGIGEYVLSDASSYTQVWDVTNPTNVRSVQNEDAAATFRFKANLGEVRKYVAVHPSDYLTPTRVGESSIANQNLKGTVMTDAQGNFQDVDYLIVTAPFMMQPALQLANHHKNVNGLRVKLISTDKIYNEFSAGKQDIAAIRNFAKYVYDNASSDANRLKYLCLFGDTSVDYKDRLQNNNNVVPTYHRNSTLAISGLTTYMSDDFFGMMDPQEGAMDSSDKLDIAVGRIVTDNVQEANALVKKITNYSLEVSFGNWRNNFVLISDDADDDSDASLQFDLDELGDEIGSQKPFVNVIKIHMDAYQQEASSGGDRYPEVNEAIENAIDVGALVMNYFGHGGEDGLARERIITKSSAQNFTNTNRYPLFVTVTCEFSRFDNPLRPTAGEYTFQNTEGGAIGLITTTRSIGVTLGRNFNIDLASNIYAYGMNDFMPPAEALRISKNEISDQLRRVVFYIGDPAMDLAFPKPAVRLTALNDVPIAQATDTLKALSRVKLAGEVVDENGNRLTNYSGVLEAKVFDKRVQRQTLGNDGVRDGNGDLIIMDFETLGEGVFNGKASVNNGVFEIEFVVPRDIAIPVGNARVSLYAKRNQILEDQNGANEELLIGGINEDAPEDNQGPLIQLFMNDENFVSGGITNDSPILIAKLEDENGINTASGIGHDIVAILDGDESDPIVLNDYYQTEVDEFTKGSLDYRLRNLEEGLHTLTLKAWDVYNNSSTAEIQFVVAGDDKLKIEKVLNYPNPFVNYTEFWFNHNRPFEPLEVQVQVFTVTGKVVWTKNQTITTDGFLSRDIVWNGRDDFGDRIGKGVYVYKLTVKSTLTNQKVEKFEKLVIL